MTYGTILPKLIEYIFNYRKGETTVANTNNALINGSPETGFALYAPNGDIIDVYGRRRDAVRGARRRGFVVAA